MSVLAGLRSESNIQFLETARQLQKYTITRMVKLPKRYTETIVGEITYYARSIYRDVLAANEYPTTLEELQTRTSYFKRALRSLKWLASELDLAYELATDPTNQSENVKALKVFAELIATETKLINGVIKKDEEQFSRLRR